MRKPYLMVVVVIGLCALTMWQLGSSTVLLSDAAAAGGVVPRGEQEEPVVEILDRDGDQVVPLMPMPDLRRGALLQALRGTISTVGRGEGGSGKFTLVRPDGEAERIEIVDGCWGVSEAEFGAYEVRDVELDGEQARILSAGFAWEGGPVSLTAAFGNSAVLSVFAIGRPGVHLSDVTIAYDPPVRLLGGIPSGVHVAPVKKGRLVSTGDSPLLSELPDRSRILWVSAEGFAWKRIVLDKSATEASVSLAASGSLAIHHFDGSEVAPEAALRLYAVEGVEGAQPGDLVCQVTDLHRIKRSRLVSSLLPGKYRARVEISMGPRGTKVFDSEVVRIVAGESTDVALNLSDQGALSSACRLSLEISGPSDILNREGNIQIDLSRLDGPVREPVFSTKVAPQSINGGHVRAFITLPTLRASLLEVSMPDAGLRRQYELSAGEDRVEMIVIDHLSDVHVRLVDVAGSVIEAPEGARVVIRSVDGAGYEAIEFFNGSSGFAEFRVPPGEYELIGAIRGYSAGPSVHKVGRGISEIVIVAKPRKECTLIVTAVNGDGKPVFMPFDFWESLIVSRAQEGVMPQMVRRGLADGFPATLKFEAAAHRYVFDQDGDWQFRLGHAGESLEFAFSEELNEDYPVVHSVVVQ